MVVYEVRFRGMNAYESGQSNTLPHHGEMRAWKPLDRNDFGCDAAKAKRRFDELVGEGIAGREVDGAIPHVVEIVRVKRVVRKEGEGAKVDSVLWQYAEPDAEQWGEWAEFEPRGGSVGDSLAA